MTISLTKELSPDLVNHEGWPLFSGRPDLKGRSIAAYTLTWREFSAEGDSLRAIVVNDLHSHFLQAVTKLDCRLQFFAAHRTMQPKTAMVGYRKLWRNLSIAPVPSGVEVGPEKLIECATGVRFAALANVSLISVPWMIGIAYKFDVVVPLLSWRSNIEDSQALDLARVAFPPDGCSVQSKMDWAAFVCRVATLGCVSVRITQDLSHGQIDADFFGSEEQVSALVSIFECGDGSTGYKLH